MTVFARLAPWFSNLFRATIRGSKEWLKGLKWVRGASLKDNLRRLAIGASFLLDGYFLTELFRKEPASIEESVDRFWTYFAMATPTEIRFLFSSAIQDQESVKMGLANLVARLAENDDEASQIKALVYMSAINDLNGGHYGNVNMTDKELETFAQVMVGFIKQDIETFKLDGEAPEVSAVVEEITSNEVFRDPSQQLGIKLFLRYIAFTENADLDQDDFDVVHSNGNNAGGQQGRGNIVFDRPVDNRQIRSSLFE
jgi:hypothetical protein